MISIAKTTEVLNSAASDSTVVDPLPTYNLLNNVAELKLLLLTALRRQSWLNVFLLAAGINQIAEDYLHPDPFMVGKSRQYLSRLPQPIRMPALRCAELAGVVLPRFLSQMPSRRFCVRWQVDFGALLDTLAGLAVAANQTPELDGTVAGAIESILARTDRFPRRLLDEVLRLPSCFRSFDQQPADLERLIERFAERWPDRARPVMVIGIRTSGSYLAPLCAAFLRAAGFEKVQTLTIRPRRKLLSHERILLQAVSKTRGLVLITDDPPTTGNSLDATAQELEALGIPHESIVLLLQLFCGATALPPILQKYQSVLLEWEAWHINEQLSPQSVKAVLSELFAPNLFVDTVERVSLPERRWVRSHVSARYRVGLAQGQDQGEQDVFVKGVGIGYFGEHTAVVAERLSAFTPTVFGVRDGLQYRAWLPEAQRLADSATMPSVPELAQAAAEYVFARHRALPVKEDISLELLGQIPVWEAASDRLSRAFRQAWWLIRIPALDPRVKRLLAVNQPSVVDGSMAISRWFRTGSCDQRGSPKIVKIDIDERDFSNLDLYCYDPIYDLAGLAASASLDDVYYPLSEQLRHAYEHLSGQSISAERWLLYQFVHVWDRSRTPSDGSADAPALPRGYAQALQGYYAELFFRDIQPRSMPGPVCALDIDGVLESEIVRASGLTLHSATALRALLFHGYRVVLATGRSLGEVRDRCRAYGLTGGVAEYGGVTYDHTTGEVCSQLDESQVADLERLQSTLLTDDASHLDPDFRYSVRAYRIDQTGQRRGLSDDTIISALEKTGLQGRVRPIRGDGQTDFVPVGIDKGTGLRSLMAQPGMQNVQQQGYPLAFAVGDTGSDLPMLELAAQAFAPANADASVRAAAAKGSRIRITKYPRQRGLARAVEDLLGHPPTGCPACKAPAYSAETHMMLRLLSVSEHSRWEIAAQALGLSLSARRL